MEIFFYSIASVILANHLDYIGNFVPLFRRPSCLFVFKFPRFNRFCAILRSLVSTRASCGNTQDPGIVLDREQSLGQFRTKSQSRTQSMPVRRLGAGHDPASEL